MQVARNLKEQEDQELYVMGHVKKYSISHWTTLTFMYVSEV